MKEKTELKIMLYFTIGYLLFFTVLSIIKGNYEFLYYSIIMGILIGITVLYHKKLHLSKHVLIGLTILGALHIFGGNIHLFGTRLYDLYLIPGIFRYDNLVHSFGIYVATFVIYSLVHPHLDKRKKHNMWLLAIILILMAMGAGAMNEILELGAVMFLGAAKQVGDYFNNAFDLVFNFLGASLASFIIIRHHKKK